VNNGEIDDILRRSARNPHQVDDALLDRITASLGSSLRPVRPLPPPWILTLGLLCVTALVAVAAAAVLGFHGIRNLDPLRRVVIFPAVAILTVLVSAVCVGEVIPGSQRLLPPRALPAAGSLALLVLFAALFHNYHTEGFVPRGIACLTAGLLVAVPAGLGCWFLLRRGFAVDPLAAGLAGGALAGFAGVAMLELHCPNFQAMHILVWHTAVMPLSAAAGAVLASRVRR
jgi:hypothetical protein